MKGHWLENDEVVAIELAEKSRNYLSVLFGAVFVTSRCTASDRCRKLLPMLGNNVRYLFPLFLDCHWFLLSPEQKEGLALPYLQANPYVRDNLELLERYLGCRWIDMEPLDNSEKSKDFFDRVMSFLESHSLRPK
jgi:hypothetical protein